MPHRKPRTGRGVLYQSLPDSGDVNQWTARPVLAYAKCHHHIGGRVGCHKNDTQRQLQQYRAPRVQTQDFSDQPVPRSVTKEILRGKPGFYLGGTTYCSCYSYVSVHSFVFVGGIRCLVVYFYMTHVRGVIVRLVQVKRSPKNLKIKNKCQLYCIEICTNPRYGKKGSTASLQDI